MRKIQTSVACCQTETQSPTWPLILFVLELQRYKATSWSGQSINTDKKLRNVCLLCSRNRIWCYHVCSNSNRLCVPHFGSLHTHILCLPFPGRAEGLPHQIAADWVENHIFDWHHAACSICKSGAPSWQQSLECCSRSPLKCWWRGHVNTIC